MPTSQAVTFAPGDTIKRVQVPINNDDVYEGLEEFTAQLTTTDSGVAIFQPDATARIRDDDGIFEFPLKVFIIFPQLCVTFALIIL